MESQRSSTASLKKNWQNELICCSTQSILLIKRNREVYPWFESVYAKKIRSKVWHLKVIRPTVATTIRKDHMNELNKDTVC